MAQRVIFFLLWLLDRSLAGFPNQINIGKCFVLLSGYRFGFVCGNKMHDCNFKPDTARGALRNDAD